MSHLDIALTRAPRLDEPALNLDTLVQVATAAGHGHNGRGMTPPSPWFSLEGNVRPSYDVHFLQTFNPDVVGHLIDRLRAAEDTLAEHGLVAPDPERHRIALLAKRRAEREAAAT